MANSPKSSPKTTRCLRQAQIKAVSIGVSGCAQAHPGNHGISDCLSGRFPDQKIADIVGIVGSPMPKGGNPLPKSKIDTIKAWINQGAQNN